MSARSGKGPAEPVAAEPPPLPLEMKKLKPLYRPPRLGDMYQIVVAPWDCSKEEKKESTKASTSVVTEEQGAVHTHRTRIATGTLNKKQSPTAASSLERKQASSAPTVDLSELRGLTKNPKEGLVWDSEALPTDQVDDYLVMMRALLEQTSHTDERGVPPWRQGAKGGLEVIPLEADEVTLQYLYKQKNDTSLAELRMYSELGMKREHKFLHALDTLYEGGASANSLDKRDRTGLIGAYEASNSHLSGTHTGLLQSSRGVPRAAQNPYAYRLPVVKPVEPPPPVDEQPPVSVEQEGSTQDEMSALGTDDEAVDGATAPVPAAAGSSVAAAPALESRKKRQADKNEAKRQWAAVQDRADLLCEIIQLARKSKGPLEQRPKQTEMYAVLRDYAALPTLDFNPSGADTIRELEECVNVIRNVLADARSYVAVIHDALNTIATADGEGSDLPTLKDTLRTVRAQPVELAEEAQLSSIISDGEKWVSSADSIIKNLDNANVGMVRELLASADAIPARLRNKAFLAERVRECEQLTREINDAVPVLVPYSRNKHSGCHKLDELRAIHHRVKTVRVHFPEGDMLTDLVARADRWTADAEEALAASPDLKKLQVLLEEASNMPVDLTATCEVLSGKVEQAHRWVEKVRKALPKKNKTRSNAADVTKVDYTAARSLLTEGADIRVDVKELDDIAVALDTAEGWLARVREALEESTDESGLVALEQLLMEADDIPVIMDEHKILAAEIEARKWGFRVWPRLKVPKITFAELDNIIAEAGKLRLKLPLNAKEQKTYQLMPEVEAKRLQDAAFAWIARYRKCFLSGSANVKKNVTLDQLLQLLEEGRGMQVELSEYLVVVESAVKGAAVWYEEARELLKACDIDVPANRAILLELNRSATESSAAGDDTPAASQDNSSAASTAAGGADAAEDATAMDVVNGEEERKTSEPPSTLEGSAAAATNGAEEAAHTGPPARQPIVYTVVPGKKVDMQQVQDCIAAAEGTSKGVELPEVEQLRKLLDQVGQWSEQLTNLCPKRLSKRKGRSKATIEEIMELVEQGNHFPVDVTEEVEKAVERIEATKRWREKGRTLLVELLHEAIRDAEDFEANKAKQVERTGLQPAMMRGNYMGGYMVEGGIIMPGPAENNDHERLTEEERREEARMNKLKELQEEATDVVLQTTEEALITKHLKSHKWIQDVADICRYTDLEHEAVADDELKQIEDAVKQGKKLLADKLRKRDKKDKRKGSAKPKEPPSDEDGARGENGQLLHEDSAASEKGEGGGRRSSASSVDGRRPSSAVKLEQEDDEEPDASVLNEDEDEDDVPPLVVGYEPAEDDLDGMKADEELEVEVGSRRDGTEAGDDEVEAEEEDEAAEEEEADRSEDECDVLLEKLMLMWWDRLQRFREVAEIARVFIIRSTKCMGGSNEKVRIEKLENLAAEAAEWDFKLDHANKLQAELDRANSIADRAKEALYGPTKLTMPAFKGLISEGDKCRAHLSELKALKKQMSMAQSWLKRFQRTNPHDIDEMMRLARDAEELRVDMGEELAHVRRLVNRCCFCRQTEHDTMVRCMECTEKYHHKCLDVSQADAQFYMERGWVCPRCLVRWHLRDALGKTMNQLARWLENAPKANEVPLPAPTPEVVLPNGQDTPVVAAAAAAVNAPGQLTSPGAAGARLPEIDLSRTGPTATKVRAWMKRLLLAIKTCAERDGDEVRVMGNPRLVKGSVLVEVIRTAKADGTIDRFPDVKEVIWNLSVVFWGTRLLCQLRRRPSLVTLQDLTAEMSSVGVNNEPLTRMLKACIARANEWIYKTKPLLREAWVNPRAQLNVDLLRALLREKRHIPIRLLLERRVDAILNGDDVPGKRYCHCRGFYDGLFMVQCIECSEWFHGKCVQIRPMDLPAKTEYTCSSCCDRLGLRYPYPPYVRPDPSQALQELEEDDDDALHAYDEEEMLADKSCLEGVWPLVDRIDGLVLKCAHVDIEVLQPPPPLVPPNKRKKLPLTQYTVRPMMMNNEYAPPPPSPAIMGPTQPMRKKPKPSMAYSGSPVPPPMTIPSPKYKESDDSLGMWHTASAPPPVKPMAKKRKKPDDELMASDLDMPPADDATDSMSVDSNGYEGKRSRTRRPPNQGDDFLVEFPSAKSGKSEFARHLADTERRERRERRLSPGNRSAMMPLAGGFAPGPAGEGYDGTDGGSAGWEPGAAATGAAAYGEVSVKADNDEY